jgi:hypothetical protein
MGNPIVFSNFTPPERYARKDTEIFSPSKLEFYRQTNISMSGERKL